VRRRPDIANDPATEQDRPERARRAAMPWVTVAAGAGAVTLVVAVAGMVGAATGGGTAVVVEGVTVDGSAGAENGLPDVTPRPGTPRPQVTRVPPPEVAEQDTATGTTTPVRPPSASAPAAPSGPPAAAAPEPEPAPSTPSPAPSPTTPAPTTEPSQESVTWVQERLRAHGATLEVTGTMDDATVAALRAFQRAHDLVGDGAVTVATTQALAASPEPVEDGSPGGTTPPEPSPRPTTDRPTTTAPGATSSDLDVVAPTLDPTS